VIGKLPLIHCPFGGEGYETKAHSIQKFSGCFNRLNSVFTGLERMVTKKSQGTVKRRSKAEQALYDAFERLKAGKPRSKALEARALSSGKSLVNITNVAIEAGLSRQLIAHKHCQYPEMRMMILEYVQTAKNSGDTLAALKELRVRVRELERKLDLRETHLAELVLENNRLRSKYEPNPPQGDNVVNFRRDRRRQ